MTPALELRGITKRFGATQVLRGVDLRVEAGERHALTGPNGAGKSTLFDLVSGRVRPNEGRVVVDGIDITGNPPQRVSRVLARSFQTTSVFGGMNRAEASRALALIRATTEGRTLLVIEHDMDAVFILADRVSVLV